MGFFKPFRQIRAYITMGIDRIGALNHSKKINSLHSKKIKNIFYISKAEFKTKGKAKS